MSDAFALTDDELRTVAQLEVEERVPDAPDSLKPILVKRLASYYRDNYWKGRFMRSAPIAAWFASGCASMSEAYVNLTPAQDLE